jgi:divalent metal cation (Fe/Co/Zn/Cd) transporter
MARRDPPHENHSFGHGKAQYFAAGVEGLMIFVAAGFIWSPRCSAFGIPSAGRRRAGAGDLHGGHGSGVMGILLVRTGASHRWVTLTADDKHLLTDVWTSFGVIVGVLLVALPHLAAAGRHRGCTRRSEHPGDEVPAGVPVLDLSA